jgi:hypothetical protein
MKACIGALLSKQADLVGAQKWYLQAINEDGDGDMSQCAPWCLLLDSQGDSEGAAYWNQRAHEAPPPQSDPGHYTRESHRLLLQELIDI